MSKLLFRSGDDWTQEMLKFISNDETLFLKTAINPHISHRNMMSLIH